MFSLLVARRWLLIVAVVLGTVLAATTPAMPVAAQACDPAYPDFCIPSFEAIGDLNCGDIVATNFTVLDPDPHQFDTDLDGIGCEATNSTGSSAAEGITATDVEPECDPSYPDLCLPPPPPDLNCDDLGFALTVIHDDAAGATDPHQLDPDENGIGCGLIDTLASSASASSGTAQDELAECDPSYPDACLPAPPPDLNCTDIGYALGVIHDATQGATDPHKLDPDGNGIGCESLAP
jgi:hypothetical protein